MKKLMVNYGGILIFYIVVILGILSLCTPNHNISHNDFKFNTLSGITK